MFKYRTILSELPSRHSSFFNDGLIKDLFNHFDDGFDDGFNSYTSNSSYALSKNQKQCMYRFPMLGVNRDDIKIDYDPSSRTLNINGKVTLEYDFNTKTDEKTQASTPTIKHKVVVPKEYNSNKPSVCTLKNGYLYIIFDVIEKASNIEFKVE